MKKSGFRGLLLLILGFSLIFTVSCGSKSQPEPGYLVILSAELGWPEEGANGCVDKLPPPIISLCLKNEGDEFVDVGQLNFLVPLFLPDQHPSEPGMPSNEVRAELESLGMGEGIIDYSGDAGFGPGVYYQGSRGLVDLGFPSELGSGEEFCVQFELSRLAAGFDPNSQDATFPTELFSMNLTGPLGPGLLLQIPASLNENKQLSMFVVKAQEPPTKCAPTPTPTSSPTPTATVVFPTPTKKLKCSYKLNKKKCEEAGGTWDSGCSQCDCP